MIEGTGGFARAYADGFNPAIIEDGLGDTIPAHGRAGEIARRSRARRRRHRRHAGAAAAARLLRRRHRLDASRHPEGDPGPAHQSASGRPAGGADVPAVQRRARLACSAGGRAYPDAGGRRLRSRPQRSPPLRDRGAHHHRARRRGGGREQRALHRRQGERAPARRTRARRNSCRRRKAAPAIPSPARSTRRASCRSCRAACPTRSAPRSSRCRRTSIGSIRAGSGKC